MVKTTTELATGLEKLNLGFDRKTWTRNWLKQKAQCPRCGSLVVRHMHNRHWKTNKCKLITALISTGKFILVPIRARAGTSS